MTDTTSPEFKQTGVYEIINNVNGHSYIGSTTMSFQKRLEHHRSLLRKGNHKNNYLQNAWNMHGEKSFSFNILKVVDKCCTLSEEQKLIDELNPIYNINPLATGTPNMSLETIAKRTASFTIFMQEAMVYYYAIKSGELEIENVDEKYHKMINAHLNQTAWNKGLTKEDRDYSYLKVPKQKKGDRTQAAQNRREKEENVFVYDIDFNFLKEFRSAKDIEEWSMTEENNFPIKSRFVGDSRMGVPIKVLQSVGVGKSCKTLKPYKNLYFRREIIKNLENNLPT